MPLKARFLLLLGTLLESLSLAIGILLIIVIICQLAKMAPGMLTTFSFLAVAIILYVTGHVLCVRVRRKYSVIRLLLPPNMPVAIVAACLQILGILGCAGALLGPLFDPAIEKTFTSSLGGYLRWAIVFLISAIFLAAGLFLRHCVFRSPTPVQGFEVFPQSKSKE